MRIHTLAIAALLSFPLGACGAGAYNGLGSDPMGMLVIHMNPYVADHVSAEQYGVTTRLAQVCHRDANQQMAGVGETVVVGGVVNGLSGAVSGNAVTGVIPGADAGVYAPYMGIANGIAGATNGLALHSQAKVSVVGSCVNGDLQDDILRSRMEGVHAYPSMVRTRNTSDPERRPSWVSPNPTQ
jgi:hypothetical protein